MSLRESVAKAQLQLLGIQSVIEAEGWDKDPDYIKRDKGRFSSNKGSSPSESKEKIELPGESQYLEQISKIEGLTKKDVDKLQKAYESLNPEQMKAYEDFMESPAIHQMYRDMGTELVTISKPAVEVYEKIQKDLGAAPQPKEVAKSVTQSIKAYIEDHPGQATVVSSVLAISAGVALLQFGVAGVYALSAVAVASTEKDLAKRALAKSNAKLWSKEVAKSVAGTSFCGIGAIMLNNAADEGAKKKAAIRLTHQLDPTGSDFRDKTQQLSKGIIDAVDKASQAFNKRFQ